MRSIVYTAVVLLATVFYSCDNSFTPKTDFQKEYILNCVLRPDTTYQTATISQSYNVSGFDPSSNTIDPSIVGAKIKLFYNDSVFVFRDSTAPRNDTSRYKDPVHFYYIKGFSFSGRKPARLEAQLPDGTVLSSSTETPELGSLFFMRGDLTIPGARSDYIHVEWQGTDASENLYFEPKLEIIYYKRSSGSGVKFSKEVPLGYFHQSGSYIPNYPIVSSQNYINFDMSAVNRAMTGIAGSDTSKKNYFILSAHLDLYIYDPNLAAYVASSQLYMDGFTVRIDQPDFTNVTGGLGIFGSFIKMRREMTMSDSFIRSFGYLPGF